MSRKTLKFITVGDSGVGKTSLLEMFCTDNFMDTHNLTIGVDYKTREIKLDDAMYKLCLWDTAGQEKFNSIIRTYYRCVDCCFIIYDVSKRVTFNNVKKWLDDFREYSESENIILLGNKIDITKREVTTVEGNDFANANNILFSEISVLENTNIYEVFVNAIKNCTGNDLHLLYQIPLESFNYNKKENTIKVKDFKRKNKKNCCY